MTVMEGTFTQCLRHYLQAEPNGRPTTLTEMKPFIEEKGPNGELRRAMVNELESYGYKVVVKG